MNLEDKILSSRRNYGELELSEKSISPDPFTQFNSWFEEVLDSNTVDPSAMVLATVDNQGIPDTRVVLLLGLEKGKLFFYTSYESLKAEQMMSNNAVAVNFYWSSFSRQVRIKGTVEKTSRELSEAYFATRERGGQLSTLGYTQSSMIKDRATLVEKFKKVENEFANREVNCPDHWGGYAITPTYYEFFQGRNSRLHDRIVYSKNEIDGSWITSRIAP